MFKQRPSVLLLALCGMIMIGIGGYFLFLRPPLLPEDLRFIGVASPATFAGVRLAAWLQKVFWVLGGFILTCGIYTTYSALVILRRRDKGSITLLSVTGVTSVGWFAFVNLLLGSDFRVPLVILAGLWTGALLLYWSGR
jgi:hypothetical protein